MRKKLIGRINDFHISCYYLRIRFHKRRKFANFANSELILDRLFGHTFKVTKNEILVRLDTMWYYSTV